MKYIKKTGKILLGTFGVLFILWVVAWIIQFGIDIFGDSPDKVVQVETAKPVNEPALEIIRKDIIQALGEGDFNWASRLFDGYINRGGNASFSEYVIYATVLFCDAQFVRADAALSILAKHYPNNTKPKELEEKFGVLRDKYADAEALQGVCREMRLADNGLFGQEQQRDKPAKQETKATIYTGIAQVQDDERKRALKTQGDIASQNAIVNRVASKNAILKQIEKSWKSEKFATVARLYDKYLQLGLNEQGINQVNTPGNNEFYIQGVNETDMNLDSLAIYMASLFCARRFYDYGYVVTMIKINYPEVLEMINFAEQQQTNLKESYHLAMQRFPDKEVKIVSVLETACSNMDLSKINIFGKKSIP